MTRAASAEMTSPRLICALPEVIHMIETRTQVTTLLNGLVVLTDPMPSMVSAFVGVWVDVGSRDEDLASSGISHMLEHMAFKGTTRRSARELSEVIEDVGAALNAYTGRDSTAYHVRTLGEHVPLAVEVLRASLNESKAT